MGNKNENAGNLGLNQEAAMFWASVVARAWEDPQFKKRLIENANEALKEMGYKEFRSGDYEGLKINFTAKEVDFKPFDFDNKTNTLCINLPESPKGFETLKFTGIFGPGVCT